MTAALPPDAVPPPPDVAPDELAPGEVADFPVEGMTCASCVRRVEKALGKVEGVRAASVNFATQRAHVTFDPAFADLAALSRAVEAAGYGVPAVPPPPVHEAEAADTAEAADASRKSAPPTEASAVDAAAERELQVLGRDLVLSAALTVPLLVLAMSHGAIAFAEAPLGRLVQLVLATIVVFGPGRRFLRLAGVALRHGAADMNTLVAIGTLSSWGYSVVALVAPELFAHGAAHGAAPHLYFEASAAIISFVLFGKWLETRSRRRLSDAVRGLMSLVPEVAHRLDGEIERDVGVHQLAVGDRVAIRPGERVPIDALVLEGSSSLDESMLTGESMPVDKAVGDPLTGGTLNQTGALRARVTRVGKDTALARIVQAVEQAQGSRAPIARLADVVSGVFVPVVVGLALVTFAVWMFLEPSAAGLSAAVERFVAVLVIACPCALGLATPAAVAVGTGRGAELGILLKGGAALEAASRVDGVLLDKTGTLTTGKPELTDILDREEGDAPDLLGLVASVESASEHPVARAIVRGAEARGVALAPVLAFASTPGRGVRAQVGGREVRIGTTAWMKEGGIDASPLEAAADRLARAGRTPSFVAVAGELAGLVAVADRPTPGAREAIAALRGLGIEVTMLTGDRRATAEAIARELGIERVVAEVLPGGKADAVAAERARGKIIAMVGDGMNDAPALAAAHVGIAVGTGTDVAVAAADIALMRGGIEQLPTALKLARRTLRTIRQNLFWAFVYNVVGIPIAAGVFVRWGLSLSPAIASAAMSMSSVSVLLNSLRVRRFRSSA